VLEIKQEGASGTGGEGSARWQAVSYRTRGGTCCPGVSTPMTQSLANLSMTNHIT
jgi:hypothetical protein